MDDQRQIILLLGNVIVAGQEAPFCRELIFSTILWQLEFNRMQRHEELLVRTFPFSASGCV
jgi:hypothetical protein